MSLGRIEVGDMIVVKRRRWWWWLTFGLLGRASKGVITSKTMTTITIDASGQRVHRPRLF